jgi:predicted O-methyltransferase YrrM
MRPAVFRFFCEILERGPRLDGRADYLEIGSFQGASLAVVATTLRTMGRLGAICSVDPYFPGGYEETPPFETEAVRKRATPRMMRQAFELYRQLDLEVEHIREISSRALVQLLRGNRLFDLIFVDGNHEGLNPMVDMALSLQLLRPGGYIVMDDNSWPDIRPIVELCDRHLPVVAKGFHKTCYGSPAA